MKLEQWLKEAKLSPAEFGKLIGVNTNSVYAYLNGNRIPKPVVMNNIYQETAKLVTANDFYNLGGKK